MVKLILLSFCIAAVISTMQATPVKEPVAEYPSREDFFNMQKQGDIRLTKEQEEKLKDPNVGWIDTFWRWPMNLQGQVIVPYVFSNRGGGFTQAQQNMMLREMREIESMTCVRFVVRTNQADWLDIISDGGCWSYVGRIRGRQELSMERPGCFEQGIALHEFGHALGFLHQHVHPERDQFVRVVWENIQPDFRDLFDLADSRQWTNFNTPYDLRSVMHYPAWAWQIAPGRDVMITHDPRYQRLIGELGTFSQGDALRVNRMYNCPT